MDTAEIVLEPCSGRVGLWLCFPAEALDCLDDIEAGREGIFRELEAVILKRAEHSIVRLWPRIEWTSTSGLQLCLWILGAAAPIYPGELPEASVSFVPRLLANVQRELEVQLVPRSEAAHQPLAEAAGEVIFSADYKLTGSWPRWITGPNGERRFSLSWWFDAEHLGEAEALLSWASGREDVLLARVVPRSAPILESDWRQLDPIWYAGEQRAFVVCRELWTGRDRALAVQPRLPEGAEIGLLGMPYPDSVQRLQPVIGVDERQGMLWRLSPKVWDTGSLLRLLHYFDEMPEDILGGIVDMGFDLEGGWAVGWSPDEILSRAHHKEYRIS
jgi:hypothetical protein